MINRWKLRNRCARKEQSPLFELFQSFDWIEICHNSDVFLHKDPFPFLRAQHVLSCHIIKVAWPCVVLPGAGSVFQSCGSSTVFIFGEGESWNSNHIVLAALVPARLLTIFLCSPQDNMPWEVSIDLCTHCQSRTKHHRLALRARCYSIWSLFPGGRGSTAFIHSGPDQTIRMLWGRGNGGGSQSRPPQMKAERLWPKTEQMTHEIEEGIN